MAARYDRKILLCAVFAFFAVAIAGPAYVPMPMNDDGTMANCPYLGITALCTMQPLEHVAALQNMLAALPAKIAGIFAAIVLLAFILFLTLADRRNAGAVRYAAFSPIGKHRRQSALSIPDAIRDAFSRGILHTKAF